jgi:hypothetical protein
MKAVGQAEPHGENQNARARAMEKPASPAAALFKKLAWLQPARQILRRSLSLVFIVGV